MIGLGANPVRKFARHGAVLRLLAVGALVLISFAASAQTAAPQPENPAPAPAQTAPPVEAQPAAPPVKKDVGFLDAVGRWLDKSASDFNDNLKKMKSSIDEFNDRAGKAAKDAAAAAKQSSDALSKLPGARIIEAREKCVIAPNGSPDCVAAAEKICKGKGFAAGKSIDTQSAQKCPARVWLSGRAPTTGECSIETFVTRAICQ
jgi:hypothetical protein